MRVEPSQDGLKPNGVLLRLQTLTGEVTRSCSEGCLRSRPSLLTSLVLLERLSPAPSRVPRQDSAPSGADPLHTAGKNFPEIQFNCIQALDPGLVVVLVASHSIALLVIPQTFLRLGHDLVWSEGDARGGKGGLFPSGSKHSRQNEAA